MPPKTSGACTTSCCAFSRLALPLRIRLTFSASIFSMSTSLLPRLSQVSSSKGGVFSSRLVRQNALRRSCKVADKSRSSSRCAGWPCRSTTSPIATSAHAACARELLSSSRAMIAQIVLQRELGFRRFAKAPLITIDQSSDRPGRGARDGLGTPYRSHASSREIMLKYRPHSSWRSRPRSRQQPGA